MTVRRPGTAPTTNSCYIVDLTEMTILVVRAARQHNVWDSCFNGLLRWDVNTDNFYLHSVQKGGGVIKQAYHRPGPKSRTVPFTRKLHCALVFVGC